MGACHDGSCPRHPITVGMALRSGARCPQRRRIPVEGHRGRVWQRVHAGSACLVDLAAWHNRTASPLAHDPGHVSQFSSRARCRERAEYAGCRASSGAANASGTTTPGPLLSHANQPCGRAAHLDEITIALTGRQSAGEGQESWRTTTRDGGLKPGRGISGVSESLPRQR